MATVVVRPQHLVALERANTVRLGGAGVKRDLAAGILSLAEALEDPRSGPVPVMDLLMAQHRWGTDRAARLLAELRISQVRRVRELTVRQRVELTDRGVSAARREQS